MANLNFSPVDYLTPESKEAYYSNLLPDDPFHCIAMACSGGGFRAASFTAGTLHYLNSLQYNGAPFIENIKILSTVSGGSIAGLLYSYTLSQGKDFDHFFTTFKTFLMEDVVGQALELLINPEWGNAEKSQNLINVFAELYNRKLFSDEEGRSGTWNDIYERSGHLEEVIINATEFVRGLPFRFQKSDYKTRFGNYYVSVPKKAAREIKLGDSLAASSCFPLGFEPICFPQDFLYAGSEKLKKLTSDLRFQKPVGLMDGGIADNQGIGSVLIAERRRRQALKDIAKGEREPLKDDRSLSLIIVTDVTSQFMDRYEPDGNSYPGTFYQNTLEGLSKKARKKIKKTSGAVWKTSLLVSVLAAAFIFLAVWSLYLADTEGIVRINLFLWTGTLIVAIILMLVLTVISVRIPRFLSRSIDSIPDRILKKTASVLNRQKIDFLYKVTFRQWRNYMQNRIASVITLNMDVFLKVVRRNVYEKVYQDEYWTYRRISNLIYDLRDDKVLNDRVQREEKDSTENGRKSRTVGDDVKQSYAETFTASLVKGKSPLKPELLKILVPSLELMQYAKTASAFGTTLWFTKEESGDNPQVNTMLEVLLATGRFTTCYNLLEYLFILKSHPAYDQKYPEGSLVRKELENLESQLRADWKKFNVNPLYKS